MCSSWSFLALKGNLGGERGEGLLQLPKEEGGGENKMGHIRNEPGINVGDDFIRGTYIVPTPKQFFYIVAGWHKVREPGNRVPR